MKILFHANTLNFRGTTVAVTDYAKYNQEILGNDSVIVYNESLGYDRDMGTEAVVLHNLKKQFNIISYREGELQKIVDRERVDFAYFIRSGQKEPLPDNVKTGVHSVFQYHEPHGDVYAYISKWLANKMQWPTFVPHMVNLPTPNNNLREKLNISKSSRVLGRYDGWNEFDIEAVKNTVVEIADNTKDIVFLLFDGGNYNDNG